MKKIYGSMPNGIPEGFAARVHYPTLAKLDLSTGDGRKLLSEGGSVRDALPLSIRTVVVDEGFGHSGAIPSGALFAVEIDTDTGNMSGDGFLLDDEVGLKTIQWVKTGAQSGNSVDLAEVKARFVEDLENGEMWIEFYEWSLAATTFVAKPAFWQAYAEVEEIKASLVADEVLVVSGEFTTRLYDADAIDVDEVTADGASKPSFEHFYIPEAETPTPIRVLENNVAYGHLGLWESCHDGVEGKCVMIPRPRDNYASFNKSTVLTDRGPVQTGPIFAFGGHRPSKSAPTIEQAYGGIENAWADVRIIEGKHGPWVSGIVRPGVTEETVYAARASRISGHWVGGRLKAIVSVNAEGFDVPACEGGELDLVAGFAFTLTEEGVSELVASFPPCLSASETEPVNDAPVVETPVIAMSHVNDDALVLALLLEESD